MPNVEVTPKSPANQLTNQTHPSEFKQEQLTMAQVSRTAQLIWRLMSNNELLFFETTKVWSSSLYSKIVKMLQIVFQLSKKKNGLYNKQGLRQLAHHFWWEDQIPSKLHNTFQMDFKKYI